MCLVTQLCPTLCVPMDCSPPGSSVHGDYPGKNTRVGCHALLQGIFLTQGSNPGLLHCRSILYCLSHQGSPRILEWVAHPFSSTSSCPGIEPPGSPALQADSLPTELSGKPSRWGKMKSVTDFIFLGSKITVDGDCSHEIKRCLLLERKDMTNLDSVLNSRDITLLT